MPLQSEEMLTEAGLKNSSAKYFPPGTVLIAMYGATVGRLGILESPATTNQAICGITSSSALYNKFLFYFLLGQRGELLSKRVGGAQPNINQQLIRELIIPLPPIAEQHRIVAEIEKQFTRLDAVEKQLASTLGKLRRCGLAILHRASTGRLVEQDPSEEPANILLEQLRVSSGCLSKKTGRRRLALHKENVSEGAQKWR